MLLEPAASRIFTTLYLHYNHFSVNIMGMEGVEPSCRSYSRIALFYATMWCVTIPPHPQISPCGFCQNSYV